MRTDMTGRFHSHSGAWKHKSARNRRPLFSILLGVPALLLFYTIYAQRWKRRAPDDRDENSILSEVLHPVTPPQLSIERSQNSGRTVYFLPGKENRCMYQYDYVCKFWFYIRCYVYAAFPNVEVLSLGAEAVSEFKRNAVDGDIAIVIWRSKNHSIIPDGLTELLEWRQETPGLKRRIPRVRIGVFHIANEVNRSDWPWYTFPDFIIRNYWIPDMPQHATYIPLGPQLPNACAPRSTERPDWFSAEQESTCACNGLGYKSASKRKYVWNFSGSLRKKRGELLRRLRKSPILHSRGVVQVSKKFGGDGVFGSILENPKNAYLESILESQFVFAPCGNAMETHRVYEALSLGAIPVVENCDPDVSDFFPLRELLIEGGPEEMLKFVESYMGKPDEIDRLQHRVTTWWKNYIHHVAHNVSVTVRRHVPTAWKRAP